jgi:hypothetical protein
VIDRLDPGHRREVMSTGSNPITYHQLQSDRASGTASKCVG